MTAIKRIFLLLLPLLTISVWARTPYQSKDGNYVGFYVDGGYTYLHTLGINTRPMNGYGVGAGFVYEYKRQHLLVNTGCGFLWQQGGLALPNTLSFQDKLTDTQGAPYTLNTTIDRYDRLRRGAVDIPLMVGGDWGWVYLLGGVKIGVGVIDQSTMNADVTTYGVYQQYISPISDASNHGFRTNVPLEQAKKWAAMIDARASLELGANLGKIETGEDTYVKARVALFADYGLFTSMYQANESTLDNRMGNYNISTYQLQPLITKGNEGFLANLLAGVKLTVLFGAGKQRTCYVCRILR